MGSRFQAHVAILVLESPHIATKSTKRYKRNRMSKNRDITIAMSYKPASSGPVAPGSMIDVNPAVATNDSGIPYPVDGTSITLTIKSIPNQKIVRNDLVMALFDSREYLRSQKRVSWLSGRDEPFSSATIPNPPDVNCVLKAKSLLPHHLTYRYMAEAVQGLMDYTFYPYNPSVDSLAFEINHKLWGDLGGGTLTTNRPNSVAR
ncbi:hypothetical protein ACLMJK_005199 [Lecanora helva]